MKCIRIQPQLLDSRAALMSPHPHFWPFSTFSPGERKVPSLPSLLCELCQVACLGRCQRIINAVFKLAQELVIPGDFRLVSKLFAKVGGKTEILVNAIHTPPFQTHCWALQIISASPSRKEAKNSEQ